MQATTSGDGINVIGLNSYKNIEALMQSTANGEVLIFGELRVGFVIFTKAWV